MNDQDQRSSLQSYLAGFITAHPDVYVHIYASEPEGVGCDVAKGGENIVSSRFLDDRNIEMAVRDCLAKYQRVHDPILNAASRCVEIAERWSPGGAIAKAIRDEFKLSE